MRNAIPQKEDKLTNCPAIGLSHSILLLNVICLILRYNIFFVLVHDIKCKCITNLHKISVRVNIATLLTPVRKHVIVECLCAAGISVIN